MNARRIIRTPSPRLAAQARLRAARGIYDGRATPAQQEYLRRCMHYHPPTGAVIIFTRDSGMHSSGWWKNPDYERCLHLSLSFGFYEQGTFHPVPFDRPTAEKWARAFFADNVSLLWIEPPYTPEGKARGVHHYRLFCDPGWQPIKPRGEVYSRRFTPADWKSWSDVHSGTGKHKGESAHA